MVKFSVILPVRNGGEYVKECVSSILSQTLADFHLHVLDNCSDDGTLEWISSLKDERIKVFPSEKPLSIEENWARIISIPKNEFMTMIGHDDVLDKNYLYVMDELIYKYPDASLYQAHFRFINSAGYFIRKCRQMQERQSGSEFLKSILTNTLDTMGTGYMMRTSHYNALGGIQPYPNLLFADHELWIRLTAISFKATTPEECFSYRVHESTSRISVVVKYVQAFFRFMEFLKEMETKDENMRVIIENYISDYVRYYSRSLAHRLLKAPEKQREGMSVTSFIDRCKLYANDLAPGNDFSPYKQFNIWLAKQIDSNMICRKLYLLFRKAYKKPIYS